MYSTATEKVRNLFNNDNASQENPQFTDNTVPPSTETTNAGNLPPQGNLSFPKINYKINDILISQVTSSAKAQGTQAAHDEAHIDVREYHQEFFHAALQDAGKALMTTKIQSESQVLQLATEIAIREQDANQIPKEIDEARNTPIEEWTKKKRIIFGASFIGWLLSILWIEVTWATSFFDDFAMSWMAAISSPLIIPLISSFGSLALKHFYYASHSELLKALTSVAIGVGFISVLTMFGFMGYEKSALSGGLLDSTGIPSWILISRLITQGILEFSIDFILVALMYDIWNSVSKYRHEVVKIQNPRYLDHLAITQSLRNSKAHLEKQIGEITEWFSSQHKQISATLNDAKARCNERLA